MMNRNSRRVLLTGAAALTLPAVLLGLSGCEDAPPPPQQTQRTVAPPPPPPPPRSKSVADLMTELNIDPRIMLDENDAPRSEQERREVLMFLDAFARGNTTALRDKLDFEDQLQLDNLMQTGRFDNTVAGIDSVMVYTGENTNQTQIGSSTANLAVLAIFSVNNEFQPTLWYLEGDQFASAPTPTDITNRMSGRSMSELIDAWHAILDQERATGRELEIDVSVPQQILEQRSRDANSPDPGAPTPPGLPTPGGPGGPPGNAPNPGAPI